MSDKLKHNNKRRLQDKPINTYIVWNLDVAWKIGIVRPINNSILMCSGLEVIPMVVTEENIRNGKINVRTSILYSRLPSNNFEVRFLRWPPGELHLAWNSCWHWCLEEKRQNKKLRFRFSLVIISIFQLYWLFDQTGFVLHPPS